MATIVQLKGFPNWTASEDLQVIVEEFGFPTQGIDISGQFAEITVPSWAAAENLVERLHKFEYTPGYPMLARVKPGQNRVVVPSQAPKGQGKTIPPKEKEPLEQLAAILTALAPATQSGDNESLQECIGAGRIEGWFVNAKAQVERKGSGNVQSFSFQGNLSFRLVNSPYLPQDFAQGDAVSFEVMKLRGKYEAVRLALPGVENEAVNIETPVVEYEAGEVPEDQTPSAKSQMRRLREESDESMLFFGNFGREVSEDVLWRFAEQAGTVKKVKIFLNPQTWVSKGCGKVHYADEEGAERALQELNGTILNDRIVLIEKLGQSSNERQSKKPKYEPKPPPVKFTEDMPKQLPLSLFSKDDTPEYKMQTCIAAFEGLLQHHNPILTGVSLILMIRGLVMEVNDLFGDDEISLQEMGNRLRKYPWFRENQQQIKWQASKKRLNISKWSGPPNPNWKNWSGWHAEKVQQVELRKQTLTQMGRTIFEVSEEEKAEALRMEGVARWS